MKTWRLITLLFAALSMGLTLLQTLYGAFGTIGAFIEVGAVVTAVVLTFLVRRRRPAFGWTFVRAVCLVAAHLAWWVWVAPVNATMAPLTPETLPIDWRGLRNQWEYTHAARAVIQIIALGALVFSILVEIPTDASRNPPV